MGPIKNYREEEHECATTSKKAFKLECALDTLLVHLKLKGCAEFGLDPAAVRLQDLQNSRLPIDEDHIPGGTVGGLKEVLVPWSPEILESRGRRILLAPGRASLSFRGLGRSLAESVSIET